MRKKLLWLSLAVVGGIILACGLLCVLIIVYPSPEQQIQGSLPQPPPSVSAPTDTPAPTITPTPTEEPTATPTNTATAISTEEPTTTPKPPAPTPEPRGLLNLQHSYAKAVLTKNGFVCDDLTIIKFKYGRYCRLDRLMEDGFVYIVELYGEDKQIVDSVDPNFIFQEVRHQLQ
jgi:hypothetical protein